MNRIMCPRILSLSYFAASEIKVNAEKKRKKNMYVGVFLICKLTTYLPLFNQETDSKYIDL